MVHLFNKLRFLITAQSIIFAVSELPPTNPEGNHLTINNHLPITAIAANKIPPSSIFLQTVGGLGNQLFQFACSYSLARRYNRSLFIYVPPTQNGRNRSFAATERQFGLDFFRLTPQTVLVDDTWDLRTSSRTVIRDKDILSQAYNANAPILQPNEYCQSQTFFAAYKNEVLDALQLKTELPILQSPSILGWISQIGGVAASVAIHIRRGDFVSLIRIPATFYENAVREMTERLHPIKPTFFLFSDESNRDVLQDEFHFLFNEETKTYFVSDPNKTNSLQEFYLMMGCNHHIIPNSSFAWWAAYLNRNPDKIVIAAHHNPKLFETIYGSNPEDALYYKFQYRYLYYPQNWFVFDPFNATML